MGSNKKQNYLIDMDGVLIRGKDLIPGADKFINELTEKDYNYLVFTNNPLYTQQDLCGRLRAIGLNIPAKRFFTSSMATACFLKSQHPNTKVKVFVIGENGLTQALSEVGYVFTDIKPDYVIMECSNVDLRDLEYIHQEENFIRLVNVTFKNMANILIPCKALGDAQEFLIRYLYYCINKNLSMPSEIFTIGSLLKVNEVYFKYKDSFKDPSFVDFFKMTMLISDFDDYIKSNFANMRDLYFENKRDDGIKLFVATGGNLEVGSSRQIYNKLKNNPNNLIITMKYPNGIKCKAKTINLKIFSLHGNFDAIMRYIKDIQRLNSSHYFLIHGSSNNLKLMNEHLNKLNIKNSIPKIGDTIKIGV